MKVNPLFPVRIIVEGDVRLAKGFLSLLGSRVIMKGSRGDALNAFKKDSAALLLIDLEDAHSNLDKVIHRDGLATGRAQGRVFFMIRNMESWIMFQPEKIAAYFGVPVPRSWPKNPQSEHDPEQWLKNLAKNSKKKSYQKIRDGAELLRSLDTQVIRKQIPELEALLQKLHGN